MTVSERPSLGEPVPRRPHAVSVQLETWKDIVGIGLGDAKLLATLQHGYPRSILHKSVKDLSIRCRDMLDQKHVRDSIMLFSSGTAASRCRDYILTLKGDKEADVRPSSVLLYLIEVLSHPGHNSYDQANDVLYAVAYPQSAAVLAATFWRLTGTGLSSRQAEDCLRKHVDLQPMQLDLSRTRPSPITLHPVYNALRLRIASLVERTVPTVPRPNKVTNSDVFLYPSGMSSIYHVHQLLLNWRPGETAILGFSYELTIKMMETYGPGLHFYSFGTDGELDQLASYLEQTPAEVHKMQAIWCECPSNPLLRTVNLRRVRQLAKKHDLVVVVDETIGGFANVDVLDVADIVISSLTKTFNGYGDVLAGSVIFNPNSVYYTELHSRLSASYANTLYVEDAIQLERNSRNYLSRTARTNETASYLVSRLISLVDDPASPIAAVYYPSVCWSVENYRAQMRPATADFIPGYGCLFTIRFEDVPSAILFFNNFHVCKGPSFGADVTIALPYVQMVLQNEKDWARRNGLEETIVRVAVGLEDRAKIWNRMEDALAAASMGRKQI